MLFTALLFTDLYYDTALPAQQRTRSREKCQWFNEHRFTIAQISAIVLEDIVFLNLDNHLKAFCQNDHKIIIENPNVIIFAIVTARDSFG